ncbi:ClpXP protease specificity-enhancing factor [Hydrogenophaga sp.]|uniref:ClpXP protease specificity-enhancing factor n=1 Tax=Hydrogenophaga sp. TaxID=1904254 RepID=UPI00271991C0|nr:ClpXP protease specificity-enhancing factor [Hydrogenophaga sp.]MDO9135626.1 ClpXP protease specificity-enhancing factor [Hydrogenophaga sp.]MDO9604226.1 ClpXP protease specificity-enhancing factor [Hydrogenophaga sp.]MDP2164972.1 ClpXP protease specificity-enhancing factor [Hydrogenophaga sp.]MDP3477857.1 ClpXP protease specificity-enhancing factor [Hydrogenophaga sp.]
MNSFESETPSTRPYLIRALHEWCVDNGFSPYIAVQVDASVRVPMEFVKNGEIVLNVGIDATSALRLGNDFIEFKARFGGVAREIIVPVSHVIAIYARENGQGMAFPAPPAAPIGVAAQAPFDVVSVAGGADDAGGAVESSARGALRAVPAEGALAGSTESSPPVPDGTPRGGGRPQLTRVK